MCSSVSVGNSVPFANNYFKRYMCFDFIQVEWFCVLYSSKWKQRWAVNHRSVTGIFFVEKCMDKTNVLNLVLGAILWNFYFWHVHNRSRISLEIILPNNINHSVFLENSEKEKIFASHLYRYLCYSYYFKMTLIYQTVFSFCMSDSFTSYNNTSLKALYLFYIIKIHWKWE